MNPTILQTIQLMASISSSEKLSKESRDMAQDILTTLLPLVKADAYKVSLEVKGIKIEQ
jgi:hypothetical protein